MCEILNQERNEAEGLFEESFEAAKSFVRDSKTMQKLSKEKIKEQIDKFSVKAKEIIDNPEKVSTALEKAIKLCDELSRVRFLGKYFTEASVICNMLNDYICKRYTKVPTATVITLLAAVLYFISPIDIIPDFLPLIGHLDDMIVFGFVQDAVKIDINKYKKWKKETEKEEVKEKNDFISEG